MIAVAEPGVAVSHPAAPGGAGVIARHSLYQVLSAAQRVTLVSGPAGSGKSVLLRSWIADEDLVGLTAWVSVAREERDPQRFWLSIFDSLRDTDACAEQVRAVTASPDLDGGSLPDWLLEDLSTLEEPLWIVFDDLHELQARVALEQFESVLVRAPARVRFVLSGRRDLPLGLHRLRLEGKLTEIRAADLRFTLEESRALFEAAGVQLSDGALESLVARTEGWAAGLRLAAMSLARNPDPEGFAADFSGSERTVAEYLLAEVLLRQPEDVSRLLLRTSILERINGPLADRLAGGSGSERILVELEEAGAFVVAVDPQRSWFRYHQLFSDLLGLELRRTAPHELPKLHAAAADWLAEHGHPIDAIRHAQAAKDWSLAARLLSDHWFGMYLDGNHATAHQLLRAFPAAMVATDAELASIAAADEMTGGSLEQAEGHLALATRESASVPEDRRERFEVVLTTLRMLFAQLRNDFTAVFQEAERLRKGDLMPPAMGQDLRAATLLNLGLAGIWTGRGEDAERYLEEAVALARRIQRPHIELGAQAHLAMVALARSASLAEERSRQAIDLAQTHGWTHENFAGVAFAVLGTLKLWRGQLSEAEQWLEQAENAIPGGAQPSTRLLLHASRALLEWARRRHEQMLAEFRAAERSLSLLATHTLAPYVRAHALLARVEMGETIRVRGALDGIDDGTGDMPELRVAQAAFHLAREQPEEAAAALALILDDVQTTTEFESRWAVHVLLLGAIAFDALRDPGGASRALERALDAAEPSRFLLPFLFYPAADLLERHVRLHTAHASLVAEILDLLSGRTPAARPGEVEPLLEPLSDAELRVLRYLPTSMQGPEIAAELFVSVNTIRTHMRHLYAKLGVHRRTDAVDRARELGLVAPRSRSR